MTFLKLLLLLVNMNQVSSLCSVSTSDPCSLENNEEMPYQFTRHPSIPFSDTTDDIKFCDLYALKNNKWYRSSYNLTNECVPHRYCGTSDPVWLNGSIPDNSDGIVDQTACVRTLFNCCEKELPVKIRNCIWYIAYCFERPNPSCHSRFCLDVDLSKTPTTTTTTTTIATTKTTRKTPGTSGNIQPERDESNQNKGKDNKVAIITLSVAVSIAVLTVGVMAVMIYHLRSQRISSSSASLSSPSGHMRMK